MSSNTYSAELRPDRTLRRLVMLIGAGLGITGVMLLLVLPLHTAVQALGSGAWLCLTWWEIATLARGFRDCRRLRFGVGGQLLCLDQSGRWCEARLLPGTAVLTGLAWIRYEAESGYRSAELVRGNARKSHDWRRLQVIWRHVGATE